jgi:hypothetical protein
MTFNKKYIQHEIVRCDPLPNEEELEAYYKDKYYQEGKGFYGAIYTEEEINHKIYESKLIIKSISSFIADDNNSKNKFLELGCGEGFLLNEAQSDIFIYI